MSCLRSFRSTCGIVLALSLSVGSVYAQPRNPPVKKLPADGTEVFRALLDFQGVKPASLTEDQATIRESTFVIILGLSPSESRNAALKGICREVLANGGGLLLAVDETAELGGFFPSPPMTGLRVTGEKIACRDTANAEKCLDRDGWYVIPQSVGLGQRFRATRIATNVPSALVLSRESPYADTLLATFPDGCVVGSPDNPRPPALNRNRLFAVMGEGPPDKPCRSLVLADPSVFINQMMANGQRFLPGQAGTDNLMFALNAVRWLRGEEQRDRCLFIVNGEVIDDFSKTGLRAMILPEVPNNLPTPPLPDPFHPAVQSALTRSANEAINDLQRRNAPNRLLVGEGRDDPRFIEVLRVLAILLTVVGIAYLIYRVRGNRHEPDATPPPVSLDHVPDTDNLTESVREYVLGLFLERGMPDVGPGRAPPSVEATGPRGRVLARQVRDLWSALFGPRAKLIDRNRWEELQPMIDAVQRAAAAGQWRFARPGGPA